ncbi:MAG TPA: protein kinase [Planctomycetaceae bacterium]|nr:protein kinase [Planctomycetaceae bacterium]
MTAEFPTEWSFAGVLVRLFAALCETSDTPPDVFAFLAEYPEATVRQRADVLLFDQFNRWRQGLGEPVETYFSRCPDVAEHDGLCLELIAEEFAYLQDCGQQPQVADFQRRFPDLAGPIARIVPDAAGRQRYASQARMLRHLLERGASSTTGFGTSTIIYRDETKYGRPRPASEPSNDSLLAGCAPFSALPGDVIRLIESRMHERTFASGEYLMRQGEFGDSLVVLLSGQVEIFTDDAQGRRTLITRTRRVQVLGEMALLTDEPRSAHVRAVQPTRVLVLPADRFHELAAQFPAISVVLTLLIAKRLGRPGRVDVLEGKTLDGYRILRRLGRGGMSVVYQAEELATGRMVALKMMSHRLVYDDAALEQFQREADIIEAFDHENVVHMYGRFAAFHTYFIVMQFCDGETLDRVIRRRGPFSEPEFRKLVGQLARALAYAHAAGVVHRDVKPSNVFLACDGSVRLMDFGLAKPVVDTHPILVNLMVGTPRYMAPEQIAGGEVGRAADYWSLGCVAWEMLAGEPLFPDSDMMDILRRHARWRSPDFREACPELSAATAEALRQSLCVDPSRRHVDFELLSTWSAPVNAGAIQA